MEPSRSISSSQKKYLVISVGALIALALFLLLVAKVYAIHDPQQGHTFWMVVENKINGHMNVIHLANDYTYKSEVKLDYSDYRVARIQSLFNQTSFEFTWSGEQFEGENKIWKVTLYAYVSPGRSTSLIFH